MATYYLSPTGNDSTGNGSISTPWFSLSRAWQDVSAGDTIYMRGGTYEYDKQTLSGKSGTSGNTINVYAYTGETPIITKSSTYGSGSWPIALIYIQNGNYLHFKGLEISYFEQENEYIWSGFWVFNSENSLFELLNYHHNGAPMTFENINNCTILNCDLHHNADPETTGDVYGNADGLAIMNDISETSDVNYVEGCRFWWNTDDGIDLYGYYGILHIENCWAWYNGYIPDTSIQGGEGNGFKLGGQTDISSNTQMRFVSNCLSFRNRSWGFTENTDTYNMKIVNNTSYQNGYVAGDWSGGYHFNTGGIPYEIKNNISYDNTGTEADLGTLTNVNHNTWDSSVTVSDADFASVSFSGIDGARDASGNLPVIDFMRLVADSSLIDIGIDVSLAYTGSAPDLGAFEYYEEASAAIFPSTGLVFYAKLDEATGNVYDQMEGYVGTVNSATLNQTGKINKCVCLDKSVPSYVDFGHISSLNFGTTGDFSMAMWFKSSNASSGQFQYPFFKYVGTSGGFGIYWQDTDKFTGFVRDSASGNVKFSEIPAATKNFLDGEWHLAILVCDRDSSFKLIVDNSYNGTDNGSTTAYDITTDNPLTLGCDSASTSYTGCIDEVAIWNRALTTEDVSTLYNGGNGVSYTGHRHIRINSSFAGKQIIFAGKRLKIIT